MLVSVDEEPILAVVVDPGRLAAGIVDRGGEVLVRDRITTPNREIWRSLEQLVRRVMAAKPDDMAMPSAVGVSCVGPLDLPSGSVSPLSMSAWSSFPLRQHLETLTELPVVLDTAAGAAAEAERWVGEAVGLASYVTLLVDQTVESACVIDGVRLSGAHGNAGSLAHLTVDPNGHRCSCGADGCLSAYASSVEIEAEISRPLRRATGSIIDRTGIMIGRAIASTAALFDVTTFFISGGVIDTFGDPVLESMRREIALRSRLANLEGLTVLEPSGLVQPLVGAAALARLLGHDESWATVR
jgi:glucokinase